MNLQQARQYIAASRTNFHTGLANCNAGLAQIDALEGALFGGTPLRTDASGNVVPGGASRSTGTSARRARSSRARRTAVNT